MNLQAWCLFFVHRQMTAFALPHKLSTAIWCNDCISIHPPLFRCCSRRSRGLIELHHLKNLIDKTGQLKSRLLWERAVFWSFVSDQQDFSLMSRRSVSRGGRGLLMLYQLAEGERQRRLRPIQRPQCKSSRMPSIPMCCVKVEPAESCERAFLLRATLNTHRQSWNRSARGTQTSTHLNDFLCAPWERVTKMPGLFTPVVSSQVIMIYSTTPGRLLQRKSLHLTV